MRHGESEIFADALGCKAGDCTHTQAKTKQSMIIRFFTRIRNLSVAALGRFVLPDNWNEDEKRKGENVV